MIDRYSTKEMRSLWSLEYKFEIWKQIEILACEYWFQAGHIPEDEWDQIRGKAVLSVERILELEKTLQHDVISFTTNLAENIGPASRHIHFGLTSSDVVDTAFSFTIQEAGALIIKRYQAILQVLYKKANKYKDQIAVGRTHGVHAEPTTIGLKLLGYFAESKRNYNRIKKALEECSFGKISGAVGTYSQLPPKLEEFVLNRLDLKPEEVSTQVVPRDRHANLLNSFALAAQGLARLAQEIRLLQKTESRELEEPFQSAQKGSSAMPHKKNPILCERICGLARVIKNYASSGMDNILLWHERDISHSSAERMIFPDVFSLLEYILIKLEFVLENLIVSADRCEKVLSMTNGLLFSSRALLVITRELQITREEAYTIVQGLADKVWASDNIHLNDLLRNDTRLQKISPEKWDEVFNIKDFLKNIDHIFARCALDESKPGS